MAPHKQRASWRARTAGLILLLIAPCLPPQPVRAEAAKPQAPIIGVNISNPQWTSREEQDRVLAEMHAAGVKVARFPLEISSGRDFGPIIDFTKRAYRLGILSNLIVQLQWPPGTQARPKTEGTIASWPQPGVSQADPALLMSTTRPLIAQLEDDGVILAGLELANEINWPQFNGDFAVPGRGKRYTPEDLAKDPEGQKVAAGFRNYILNLAVLKAIRDESRLNKKTPIISAGMADVSPFGPKPEEKIDSVEIETTLVYLRSHGLDALVDFYGVHTYAGETEPLRSNMKMAPGYLQRYVFSMCRPSGGGKPCWITEWGLLMPDLSCPPKDKERLRTTQSFMSALKPFWSDRSVTALFYYDWSDQVKPFGLFACSGLTGTGRAVLSGP